jgi:signal transduction histidine kinase
MIIRPAERSGALTAIPASSRRAHVTTIIRITLIGIVISEVVTVSLSYLLRGEFIREGPIIALVCAGPICVWIADRGLRAQQLISNQRDQLLDLNAELEERHDELRDGRDALQAAHENVKTAQSRLLSAHKLEAIGQLAAGIAHEINTPIQFVSDNTSFVKDGVTALGELAVLHSRFLDDHAANPEVAMEIGELKRTWVDKDTDFLLEEMPAAIEETLDGANRVAEIVRAMKEFAHPGSATKSGVDVNRVINTSMQVSRNEWKQVAELQLELDETIPPVWGLAGPLGQTLLILLVNAAQAIAEDRNGSSGKGTIRVTTGQVDGAIEIRVADDGPGVPAEIVDRIFDPFFTTRDVGEGSGQGLPIARSVVVDKHDGEIWVEDAEPGAVFVIRLPTAVADEPGPDQHNETVPRAPSLAT